MQQTDSPRRSHRDGLHTAAGGGRVYGNYEGMTMKSLYTRARLNPVLTSIVAIAVGAGIALLLGGNNVGREEVMDVEY
jgi:hypothetical protein